MEWWILPYEVFLSYFVGFFLARRKILHGVEGFTAPRKEGVLQIFITLKNPSLRPGLDPQTFGAVADTLTIRPLRTTLFIVTEDDNENRKMNRSTNRLEDRISEHK
jgi:hypothetical protein